MKKLYCLITLTFFCVMALSTQSFAAPQNAQGGGALTKRTNANTSNQRTTNTRTTNTKKPTTKAAAKRAASKTGTLLTPRTSTKTKAQERKEAQNQQFGLMPSELDESNHNVFHADAAAIKGARDTESALRYLPFVTIINTAGFGQQFDLRAQGRLSSNGVKLYLNGIPANPVDTYTNPMPINTIIPSLINEVSVTPGGGAVLYGSGAKGGTINIITSKRQAPYFLVGGGYVNTMATQGNSFNVYAQAAEDISKHIKMNAGLGFNQMGGPREDDSATQGQAIVGAWYDIGWGQSVSADIDVFYGKVKSTPYGSLVNEDTIGYTMTRSPGLYQNNNTDNTNNQQGQTWVDYQRLNGAWEYQRYLCLSGSNCNYNLYGFEPDKTNRADKGNGEIETTNIRATGKLGWESQATKNLKVNVDAFYSLSQLKYDKYAMNLPYFVLGYVNPQNLSERGYNWFLPRVWGRSTAPGYRTWQNERPIWTQASQTGIDLSDGQRADWHFFDQSGSTFKESKLGIQAKMDLKHNNGQLFIGASSVYEMSNKKSKSHLRQAITDGYMYGGSKPDAGVETDTVDPNYTPANPVAANVFRTLVVDIFDKTDISVLTNSIYLLERYDLNRNFSIMAGARYEMKNYSIKVSDEFSGQKVQFQGGRTENENNNVWQDTKTDLSNYSVANTANGNFSDDYKKNYDNFTFEIAPVYKYSNSGSIYARGELGYIAPPAWAMLQRIGIVRGAVQQPDIFSDELGFNFAWLPTDLESETYYTAELGFKEIIGTRRIPLGITNLTLNALLFSANLFYTNSQNEFYFTGDTWSGMDLGTYEKSRRMGVELAFEQYLFDGALGFNESFTYLKAQKFDCKDKTAGICRDSKEWSAIPYTYDWKATLGAAVNVSTFMEVTDVAVSIWLQNSIYGNQNVYATQMRVNTQNGGQASTTNPLQFSVVQQDDTKLKPYIISDFGVSVALNKGMGVVTVGVKNVFDTFYYDYYNNDRSAVVSENRYVIGRGRTVFVEGSFRY